MGYKFHFPTYAGYPLVDAIISSCDQTPFADPQGDGICNLTLHCVLSQIDNALMAQFAAGATILGFIPTILSMVGTSRDDHLRIHRRFPILAFILSACNPSTIVAGLVWRTDIPPCCLRITFKLRPAAGLAIWQAVLLGVRGIVSFACPTWFNPLFWVLVGPLAQLIDVTVSRWCIEGPYRWSWNLGAVPVNGIKMRRSWMMRLKDMFLTTLALADYVYGTVILSSMQLVAPRPALQIAVVFTLPAIFARLVSIFMLERRPRDHRDSLVDDIVDCINGTASLIFCSLTARRLALGLATIPSLEGSLNRISKIHELMIKFPDTDDLKYSVVDRTHGITDTLENLIAQPPLRHFTVRRALNIPASFILRVVSSVSSFSIIWFNLSTGEASLGFNAEVPVDSHVSLTSLIRVLSVCTSTLGYPSDFFSYGRPIAPTPQDRRSAQVVQLSRYHPPLELSVSVPDNGLEASVH
ncbi:hypothetical protein C8J57DRAFT_1705863 [Mycena rebaudengoi]|nr:hypothetical protein C8J57DRAFT_1705863 [Mycena rebaudengoi]